MNNSKVKEAMECFGNGFNCSQAIVSTYCEELGLDKKTALQMASGFGAGMGRRQETCGAVTGAYLLIGLKYGNSTETDNPAKEKTYACVQEFTRLFEERNNSVNCRTLLGVDLINDDSQIVAKQWKTLCPKLVRDAAEIVECILFSESE